MLEYLIININIHNNIFTACNGENFAEIKEATL